MKRIDLGQSIAILANIGVIAGIAFLAIELQQNNDLMAAQARFNLLETRTESYTLQITEPDLAEALIKDRNGQTLTEVEDLRVQAYWTRVFRVLEWLSAEVPDDRGWLGGQGRNYVTYPSYRRAWEGGSGGPPSGGREVMDADFVRLMEETFAAL